jgi:hypothetical protein
MFLYGRLGTSMEALILIVIVAGIVLAAGFWFTQRSRRRQELKGRFGSEYDRTIETAGSRGEGEKELAEREKRVEFLELKALDPRETQRFGDEWRNTQGRFVDNPAASIQEADSLVQEVMTARGYPITNFEQQAADISVDHPNVLNNYRAAHAIAEENAVEPASTEALRQAMIHYRALFDELLVPAELARSDAKR